MRRKKWAGKEGINHAGPGTTSNARISAIRRIMIDPITRKPCVSILATRTIKPGEEVLISYNKSWKWDWKTQEKAKPQNMQRAVMLRSPSEQLAMRHRRGRGRGRGRGLGGRGRGAHRPRRRSRCDINMNVIQTIMEAAGNLGHRAKSNLARLWNSGDG